MHGSAFAIDQELPQRVVPDDASTEKGFTSLPNPRATTSALPSLSWAVVVWLPCLKCCWIEGFLVQLIAQRSLGQAVVGAGPFLELHGMAGLARGITRIPGEGRGVIFHRSVPMEAGGWRSLQRVRAPA